jgi:hypothetical protein
MKNLILTSILFLISLISFSQTNISFINENVIYFESEKNLGINESIISTETRFFTENKSYGIYSVDLKNKLISLNYKGVDYNWYILENKMEGGFLYLKVYEGIDFNKNEMIAYYRINTNKNEDISFVYQTYDNERNISWGIVSKEIKNLLCD